MAATYTDNGGSVNGSNKVFTYSFPVLQTEDIQVALNGVTQATDRYTPSLTPANITFHNSNGVDSTVQEADGAPKNGVTVRVYRKTTVGKTDGNEDPKAVFAAGSSIRAGDLNANIEQALFGIHEQQTNLILAEDINTGAITSAKILDDTIVDADVNSSAAIAGTKVSPNFGSQAVVTTGTLASGAATVTGNIAVSGTVDGRDVAADGTKLDTIESNATADQSNAEIRAAVEAASDSNVFTDADHSKLNAIEPSATADQTASEIRTLVESASDSNVFTDADHSKLNAIEPSATADQTASEIRTLVESASDSNVFTDADHSRLDALALTTKGTIAVGDGVGQPTILPVGTNNHVLVADSNEASGVKWATVPAGSGLSNVVEDTTPQLGGDLDVNGNDIVSTSNANINIIPNGTGDVNLDADTIRVGDNNTDTTITTQGTGDLTLSTNSGTNSGTIEIEDGADNDIVITPNGTGDVVIDGLKYPQADGSAGQYLKTNGSAQLSWSTVTTDLVGDTSPQLGGDLDVNGNEIISSTTDQDITIRPNGTGDINLQTDAGGTTKLCGAGGDAYFPGHFTNGICYWDYSQAQLEFWNGVKASFGSGEDLEIWHDSPNTINQIKGNNGKILISTNANNDDIEITPHGTGDVVIDGLKYPQADGSAGQFLKTNGSAQLSWDTPTPADNSVTAAKTDISIVAGDLIYGNGTDSWTRLAKSTAGKVLTMNTGATAPEWADAAGGGAVGGGSDKIFMENGQTVTTNYTIGTEFRTTTIGAACNALSAGPITINDSVVVTIDSGDNWTIV